METRPPSTATRSTNSISRHWKARRSGRHPSSSRTSMIYGCRLTLKESVQSSMSYHPICILRSSSNPNQANPDLHGDWKATISLINQAMKSHPCWRKLTVNQAVLLHQISPQQTSLSERIERRASKTLMKRGPPGELRQNGRVD